MASTKNRSLSIKKIVAYSAVGTIAFVSEYLSFIIIINTLAIPYTLLVAQSISFGLGLVISFNGNRLFAFKDIGRVYLYGAKHQIGMYLVLASINLLLSNVIIQVLIKGLFIIPPISKLIVMSMVVLWNYVIFNNIIFKSEHR